MKIKILFVMLGLPGLLSAQSTVLDRYVQEGLKCNLALQQKAFSLQKSGAALREARGMFLPSVGIQARYSRAGGGRIIDFPVGDLMNPVYATLNSLTGQAVFPTNIPNQSIPFLREEEHETKIRLVQPLFQPALLYNVKMRRRMQEMEAAGKAVYARQLVAEIKSAYFNYLKTLQVQALLDQTQELLDENLRICESLFNNDKATKAVVYRAQAELFAFKQSRADADKNRVMAASYFNFLLNRSLDAEIEVMKDTLPDPAIPKDLAALEAEALENREELSQLTLAADVMQNKMRLSQSAYLPGVALVADYGYQGEEYSFTKDDDYWMASLVLEWNLFHGFQDRNKVQQARLDKKKSMTRLEEVKNQIRMQVREAAENLDVAKKKEKAAQAQVRSAEKSFEMTERLFKEGMAPHLEFIDARRALTEAKMALIFAKYDITIQMAELEKVLAAYSLNEGENQ